MDLTGVIPMPSDPESMDPKHLETLSGALARLGCPEDRCDLLASQLDKRARQLSDMKGRSYEDALVHLMSLMQQGWVANVASDPNVDRKHNS